MGGAAHGCGRALSWGPRGRIGVSRRGWRNLDTAAVAPATRPNPGACTIETEVLIAGGGPCGLMLAIELGRRGIPCLLADPKPGTTPNPQAGATQARTMEHFRRLGFADEVRALGLPADHPTDIVYGTRFAAHELARLVLPTAAEAAARVRSLGGSWSAAELPHRVSQKYVEACLLRHARTCPSVQTRHGWTVEAFDDQGDGIVAELQPFDGSAAETVQARYLVGADGARSAVRRRLGIEWGGVSGIRRDFMGGRMLAVHLRSPAFAELMAPRRAWMRVAVNAQRRSFVMAVDGAIEFVFHAALNEDEGAEEWSVDGARRLFAEAVGQAVDVEVLSVGNWLAGHALVAQHFQRGRVFLAGDAAHLFTPTGGLGYNTAVEDAVNLGWKLASVLRGSAPVALLDSYEAERRPLAQRNTAYARRFADSIGLFPAPPELEDDSPAGAASRAAAASYLGAHARLEFNIPGVTFGGRYDGSPVIAAEPGSLPPPDEANQYVPSAIPGGRAPHAWLADGRSLYDALHFGWTLLALGADAPDTAPFEQQAAVRSLDLRVLRLTEPTLRALYEAALVLLRPDQIVAWRGADAGAAAQVLDLVTGLTHRDDDGTGNTSDRAVTSRPVPSLGCGQPNRDPDA